MEWILILVVPAFVALVIFGIIQGARSQRRQLAQKQRLAARLECEFHEKDPYRLAGRFERHFPSLKAGSNRYAFNVMVGRWRDLPIWIFDHHHETTSTDSEGNSKTDHHYAAYIVLHHEFMAGGLEVRREHFFDGIGSFFGYDDIDFESEEFSRQWHVKADDRQVAYEIFDPPMIEYFLKLKKFSLAMREGWGLYPVAGGMSAFETRKTLRRLRGFLERIPRFVRKDYSRT